MDDIKNNTEVEFYKPTEKEEQNCNKGISCNFGICDECEVTHRTDIN